MMGVRIAALRKAAGMSQAQLAQRLRISNSAVGMYEQGRREPSVDTLKTMADIFGVSLDFLVAGRPGSIEEAKIMEEMIFEKTASAELKAARREARPFSKQELAVLFAAMMIDS